MTFSSIASPSWLRCAALTACFGICACGSTQTNPQSPETSSPSTTTVTSAPDFSIDLTTGDRYRLSEHVGKDVIVIDFWTTFCVPCVAVLQHLQGLHERYKDKGLSILAVAMDPPETAGQIKTFTRSHNLTFPVAHDVDSQITNMYNKKTVAPYQVLIGKDGRIIKRRESYQPGDEAGMEADIKAALGVKD